MLYCVIVYAREGIRTSYHATETEARQVADLYFTPEKIDTLGIGDIVITKTLKLYDCRDHRQPAA